MAGVSFSAGCMGGDIMETNMGSDEAAGEPLSSAVALEALENQFEQISWQMGVGGADWRHELPRQPDGLCECNAIGCQEDWVDDNVGCDVCITIQCTGEPSAHVCVSC